MTRIAIGVLILSLVRSPSWAAQPPDQETSRPGVGVEADLSDSSEDQSADEPLSAAAVGAPASPDANDQAWPPDPSSTRLLVASTGRALKRGELYLDAYGVSVAFVQVGLTDRISIGGGAPVFFPSTEVPFWITPKVQVFAGQKTTAAVGLLHVANVGPRSVGVAYGVVTRGTADAAVTAGLGYAYSWRAGGAPVVLVGGETRVSRKVKLITENYLLRGGGLASGGVRLLGDRWAVDLGVAAPFIAHEVFAFPTVRFMWKFRETSRAPSRSKARA